jgi:heme/copper-type cytochrome/quinol oxidase subunit 3
MTIPARLAAVVLICLTGLVAWGLFAIGVPVLFLVPAAAYTLAIAFLVASRWIGDLGLILGNTMLILAAMAIGVTVAFAHVDLDAEDPRTLAGWTAFGVALVLPYALYGGYRGLDNWHRARTDPPNRVSRARR